MTRHFICVLVIFLTLFAHAQFVTVDYDSPRFKTFLATKTLVVMQEDDEAYNRELMNVMKAVWKVTAYDFIPIAEVGAYYSNENFSILMPVAINYPDYENLQSNYLAVMLCGRKSLNDKGFPTTTIAKVVLDAPARCGTCYDNRNNADINIRQLCEAFDITISKMIKQKEFNVIRSEYVKNSPRIRERTLAVHDVILRPASNHKKKWIDEAGFRSVYPYSMKVVTDQAIDRMIAGRDTTHYVLYKEFDVVDSEKFFYLIMDPSNGHIMYMHPFTKETMLERTALEEMVNQIRK